MRKLYPVLVVLVLACVACPSRAPDESAPPAAAPDESKAPAGVPVGPAEAGLRVTGPYAHENLAVYLIHSEKPDSRQFITLDEGLKKKWVEVSEKADEQVNELEIENRSDKPLFLQEGDRLTGGKQDRIIGLSMVVPPNSGKMKVPAFCVEQNRWSIGAYGEEFASTANSALASQSVRFASKVANDQGQVWEAVASQKSALESHGVGNTTSSLNEAIDSEEMKKVSDEYESQLGDIFAKHADAVGVAFVLNGEVLEVDIYPGNDLLKRISPRLLKGYAIQAIAEKKEGVEHPEPSAIAAFMKEAGKKAERTQDIDGRNRFRLVHYDKRVNCETVYEGERVHLQWLAEK